MHDFIYADLQTVEVDIKEWTGITKKTTGVIEGSLEERHDAMVSLGGEDNVTESILIIKKKKIHYVKQKCG